MWSRLHQPVAFLTRMPPRTPKAQIQFRKISFGFPTQYPQPVSKNFKISHALRHNWELIPLLACIVVDVFLMVGATYNSLANKVDIQITGHNWNSISRRMDLREPTIHKLLVYNEKYEPWPQMQDVLDRMAEKEIKPCALRAGKS